MLIKNGRMKFDNFIIEKYIIFDDCRIRLIIMNTFIQFIHFYPSNTNGDKYQ